MAKARRRRKKKTKTSRRKKKTRTSRRKTKTRSLRSRRKKTTKKPKVKKILLTGVIVIAILSLIMFFSNPVDQQQPTSSEEQGGEPVTDYTSGGACKRNLECFSVSCKSDIEDLECVNAEKMLTYHENCEAYWDVNIETQDFSECACIDGYCREP